MFEGYCSSTVYATSVKNSTSYLQLFDSKNDEEKNVQRKQKGMQ
jgi:hypothetical protein